MHPKDSLFFDLQWGEEQHQLNTEHDVPSLRPRQLALHESYLATLLELLDGAQMAAPGEVVEAGQVYGLEQQPQRCQSQARPYLKRLHFVQMPNFVWQKLKPQSDIPRYQMGEVEAYRFALYQNELTVYVHRQEDLLRAWPLLFRALGCWRTEMNAPWQLGPVTAFREAILSGGAYCYDLVPHMALRNVCIEGANSAEQIAKSLYYIFDLGMNSFFFQFLDPSTFMRRYEEHDSNPFLSPVEHSDAVYEAWDQAHSELCLDLGLEEERAGHGWTCHILGLPEGWQTVSDETLSADLRAMTAELKGKRGLHDNNPTNTNLCYSHPEVQERLCEAVWHYLEAHPNCGAIHIWLADGMNGICECEHCQDQRPADQYIELLNKVDSYLLERGRSLQLLILLYVDLLWPAEKAQILHPERAALVWAPISRSFEKSYDESMGRQLALNSAAPLSTDHIPPYVRNHIQLPRDLEGNVAFLESWIAAYPDLPVLVYDYPMGRAHYGDFSYLSIARTIAQDVAALPAMGISGYLSCQELRVAFPHGLPLFVLGQALLDGKKTLQNFDQITTAYLSLYFGQANAQAVQSYLKDLAEAPLMDYYMGKGERVDQGILQRVEHLLAVRQKAPSLQLEGLTPIQQRHVDVLRDHGDYLDQLLPALEAQASGQLEKARRLAIDALQQVQKQEEAVLDQLDVYRIIEVSWNYVFRGLNLRDKLRYNRENEGQAGGSSFAVG